MNHYKTKNLRLPSTEIRTSSGYIGYIKSRNVGCLFRVVYGREG